MLAAICAVVIGVYVALAWTRVSEMGNRTPRDAYYNLLVDGFGAGQLNLPREVPAGLAALPDPYDPKANAVFRGPIFVDENRLHDLSYYRGRLYLYFGVTPGACVVLAVCGADRALPRACPGGSHFCSDRIPAGAWLLWSAWRRYFRETSVVTAMAGSVALGLGSGIPVMLSRPDVWEVPIACAYALTMLALVALWSAVHDSRGRVLALATASLAYGLAVGARPTVLFGAVVLLVPACRAWVPRLDPEYEAGEWRRLLLAAVAPIGLIGLGLAAYNYLRFGSVTEFGQTFQLAGERQDINHFSVRFASFNLRAYFFAFGNWFGSFPYFQPPDLPPLPPGHGGVENPFPLLSNAPFAWLALAAPLALKGRVSGERCRLRAFIVSVAVVFFFAAFVLALFFGTTLRYEIEFSPALFLLAALGAFAVDRFVAGRPRARRGSAPPASSWGWCRPPAISSPRARSVGRWTMFADTSCWSTSARPRRFRSLNRPFGRCRPRPRSG